MREMINVQHTIGEIEEIRLRLFGHLTRMGNNRIPNDTGKEFGGLEEKGESYGTVVGWCNKMCDQQSPHRKIQRAENCSRAKFLWDEGCLLYCEKILKNILL